MKNRYYMKFSITQIIKRWLAGLSLYALFGRDFLLEVIFPRGGVVGALEKMTADEALRQLPLCGVIEDDIFAVFHYRHVITRRLIWELKYRGNKKVAMLCAEVLWRIIGEKFSINSWSPTVAPILIPVPLTRARRRERGFNQNELVIAEIMKIVDAEKFAKLDGKSFPHQTNFSFSFDALVKTRGTAPQSSIKNRAERLKNLNGCFAVPRPELVRGKNIILIDDVATTGSTLNEARTALLSAGALSVCAVAIAH